MKKCKHRRRRYLDCEDCREKGKKCELVICIDCGESVNLPPNSVTNASAGAKGMDVSLHAVDGQKSAASDAEGEILKAGTPANPALAKLHYRRLTKKEIKELLVFFRKLTPTIIRHMQFFYAMGKALEEIRKENLAKGQPCNQLGKVKQVASRTTLRPAKNIGHDNTDVKK